MNTSAKMCGTQEEKATLVQQHKHAAPLEGIKMLQILIVCFAYLPFFFLSLWYLQHPGIHSAFLANSYGGRWSCLESWHQTPDSASCFRHLAGTLPRGRRAAGSLDVFLCQDQDPNRTGIPQCICPTDFWMKFLSNLCGIPRRHPYFHGEILTLMAEYGVFEMLKTPNYCLLESPDCQTGCQLVKHTLMCH